MIRKLLPLLVARRLKDLERAEYMDGAEDWLTHLIRFRLDLSEAKPLLPMLKYQVRATASVTHLVIFIVILKYQAFFILGL